MSYLTEDHVQELNEKHGWFQYGDAKSDVSKAFAEDAIIMHERVRAAAPNLLAVVHKFLLIANTGNPQELINDISNLCKPAAEAWDKAMLAPVKPT